MNEKKMIYFDNAATSFYRPLCVGEAVKKAIAACSNASRGAYESSLHSDRILFEAREMLCDLFHADSPSRIAFTRNATEALNTALFGIGLKRGDHLIVSVNEHNSVLRPAYRLQKRGIVLHVIGVDPKGVFDYAEFEKTMDRISQKKKIAAAISHASNVTGNVTDLGRVGKICRDHQAILIADAAQTAGCIPIDMKKMKVDILCFSGPKSLMGPQGTGGIAVREGLELTPFLEGGSGIFSFLKDMPEAMPEHLEAGTQNAHAVAGLLSALKFSDGKRRDWYRKENELRLYFLKGIREINQSSEKKNRKDKADGDGKKITVYGNQNTHPHLPIVSFNVAGTDSKKVSDILWKKQRIAIRPGIHCAPLIHQFYKTEKTGMARVSFSHYNTRKQIDELLKIISAI